MAKNSMIPALGKIKQFGLKLKHENENMRGTTLLRYRLRRWGNRCSGGLDLDIRETLNGIHGLQRERLHHHHMALSSKFTLHRHANAWISCDYAFAEEGRELPQAKSKNESNYGKNGNGDGNSNLTSNFQKQKQEQPPQKI